MIDQYVQEHMWEDDAFDPMESAYREIVNDSTTGDYPAQLSKAASAALGEGKAKSIIKTPTSRKAPSSKTESEPKNFSDKVVQLITRSVVTLNERFGVPKPLGALLVSTVVLIMPFVVVLSYFISYSTSQKAMTEQLAIDRYGESVLDARELS